MSDIFISYSRQDKAWVARLAAELEARGYDVWWDTEILPGQEFESLIRDVLSNVKCVITIWSNASIASHWVRDESSEGLKRRILIPILCENVTPPMSFRSIHTADMIGWKGDVDDHRFQSVLKAIEHYSGEQQRTLSSPKVSGEEKSSSLKMVGIVGVVAVLGVGGYFAMQNSLFGGNGVDADLHASTEQSEANNGGVSVVTDSESNKLDNQHRSPTKEENERLVKGIKAFDLKQYGEAIEYFQPLADIENGSAKFYLARLYESGKGVAKDEIKSSKLLKESLSWLKMEAKSGNTEAQLDLGVLFQYGRGVEQSDQKALDWYQKAAYQNNADAQNRLGWLYANGHGIEQSYEEAAKWYQKAAQQGYAHAQFNLGDFYRKGFFVKQSYEEAAMWYRKAANQGNVNAQTNLGWMYANGHGGLEQSYEKAVKWYRKAADQDGTQAQANLGNFYRQGRGVEESYEEAVKWYRKAAIKGNANAQTNLGWMYEKGYGVEQSYEEAVKWYRRAVEQKNASAQVNLGWMYQNGYGVPQSNALAEKWYRRAAEQGSVKAKEKLNDLLFKSPH